MADQISTAIVLALWFLLAAFVIWLLVHNLKTGMTGVPRSWPHQTLYRSKQPIRYWFMVTAHAGFAAYLVFMFFYLIYKLK